MHPYIMWKKIKIFEKIKLVYDKKNVQKHV